jgi:hypothetical protein
MTKPAPAAVPEPEPVGLPGERDRELLDYLIDRAIERVLRDLGTRPANDNDSPKRSG